MFSIIISEFWSRGHMNKVQGHTDYHRDDTGAIINHDKSSFEAYKKQKAMAERNLSYDREIADLKRDVADIKGLLKELISKL